MNIDRRYQRLLDRRTRPGEATIYKSALRSSLDFSEGPTLLKYIKGALSPIDEKSTALLIEQGERVKRQLSWRLDAEANRIQFRPQGSASNDTHIRYHSDVDLLVISGDFVMLEHPQVAIPRYAGNPVVDLLVLRRDCSIHLAAAFPKANLDDSSSTALSLEDGSLTSKVDIVPSNWFDSNAYEQAKIEYLRGIQVIDKNTHIRTTNYPFLFNHRIDVADDRVGGRMRMLIRLLKTLRADAERSEKIGFSSFDISSLIYRMPDQYWNFDITDPIAAVISLFRWVGAVYGDKTLRDSLWVVDDSRKIFDNTNTFTQFGLLLMECFHIYEAASKEQESIQLITSRHLY